MKELISTLLKCQDVPLLQKISDAIEIFDSLDLSKTYTIGFSGGKDSHALLICFLLWKQIRNITTDNFTVVFSDTMLEVESLYLVVENIEKYCKNIIFERRKPEHTYWYYQFVVGYPVPTHFNRWCTKSLKVDPMNSKGAIPITGRHLGESKDRDNRLQSSCSSGECGIDKIKKSYDPIINFRNCDVWDLIFFADGTVLYDGVFNLLRNTYNQSEDKSGSLRMGCIMCPVISVSSLSSNISSKPFLGIRDTLEKLRKCRRILNPKLKKLGAIYIGDRRLIWKQLNKELLLSFGYITLDEIDLIDELICSDYSYPKTYTKDWVDSEHKKILYTAISNTFNYSDLPLFK